MGDESTLASKITRGASWVAVVAFLLSAIMNDWQSEPWHGVWLVASVGIFMIVGSSKQANSPLRMWTLIVLTVVALSAFALHFLTS